jgi:hypothetical protein
MSKFLTRSIPFAALLAVFAAAGVAQANHSWGNYHWARTANPFTLKLGDAVSGSWDAYLSEASSDWSTSSVLDTTIVASTVNPKTCKATNGRVEVCNAKYGRNGWLGIATIWLDSQGHITKGTAKMNDTYFSTASYNTPAWKRLVMCQEIAHTFGLDHQDETFDNANLGTCMDYTNDPDGGMGGASASDPSNEHPNAHDFEELETIYAHTDTYATLSAALAQALPGLRLGMAVKEDDETDLGTATGRDGHGRANVFEKNLGGGAKRITHVFWLPE